VLWQYVLQSVVCVLGAVRRVTAFVGKKKKGFELIKIHGKKQLK
jgi:hypothetical protein